MLLYKSQENATNLIMTFAYKIHFFFVTSDVSLDFLKKAHLPLQEKYPNY